MLLNHNDLNFILDKTKLELKRLLLLIEEERDFDLVLHSIASNLTEQDKIVLSKLSNKLRIKIILYNLTQEKDYDIKEKSYICDILSQNYNYIYKTGYILKDGQKMAIKQFIHIINDKVIHKDRIKTIAQNFIKLGRKDIGSHLSDWVNIVQKSKQFINNGVNK